MLNADDTPHSVSADPDTARYNLLVASRARIVTRPFSAKHLYVVPSQHETFEKGNKLVFLRLEEGHTIFMRRLEKRNPWPCFIVDEATFAKSTKAD